MSGALPNLIVIGAQKAGTTLLHGLLDAQPGVAMSARKELDFFTSENGGRRRGLDWYREQFDPGASIRGESSPSYTAFPFAEGVPERIAAALGDVRFVYLVRDPVERALSALRHRIGEGYERQTPEAVLANPGLEATAYVAMSRYAMQLERYTNIFGAEAVLVADFDELVGDAAAVVERVLAHCGHEAEVAAVAADEINPAANWPLRRAARRLLPERAVRRLIELPLVRRLDHRLMRSAPRIEAGAEGRESLASLVRNDAARLREMTGLPFAGWSV